MTAPILVCGLGRCGTSMLMQILHCGGYPTYGEWPAFEPDDLNITRDMFNMLPKLAGKAAKVLDPHRSKWPMNPNIRVIWLDRDLKQQAKSQIKFVRMVGGFEVDNSPAATRRFMIGLQADRARCIALLDGVPMLRLTFDGVLRRPLQAAKEIQAFVGTGLDINAMAAAVIKRSPRCQTGLLIEEKLCEGVA